MADIEITFDTDGTSQIHVNGTKGSSCKDLTKPFEKALGTVTNDKKTSEFYQTETNKNVIRRNI